MVPRTIDIGMGVDGSLAKYGSRQEAGGGCGRYGSWEGASPVVQRERTDEVSGRGSWTKLACNRTWLNHNAREEFFVNLNQEAQCHKTVFRRVVQPSCAEVDEDRAK